MWICCGDRPGAAKPAPRATRKPVVHPSPEAMDACDDRGQFRAGGAAVPAGSHRLLQRFPGARRGRHPEPGDGTQASPVHRTTGRRLFLPLLRASPAILAGFSALAAVNFLLRGTSFALGRVMVMDLNRMASRSRMS